MAEYQATFNSVAPEHPTLDLIRLKRWWKHALEEVKNREIITRNRLASIHQKLWKRTKEKNRQAQRALQEVIEGWNRIDRADAYRKFFKDTEEDCFELSLRIAEEFIGEVFQKDQRALKKRIESELESITDLHRAKISLSPQAFKELKKKFDEFYPEIEVEENKEIANGNAQILTNEGVIEIDWETDLKRYRDSLLQAFFSTEKRNGIS